jgi:ATP-dependent Lhr-like helicase
MDLPRLIGILERIHRAEIRCIARDTPEPSPLCHEILNAQPYAFVDDAPLEERRARAVQTRRATDPAGGGDLGALDPAAIARVVGDAWPDPRDAEELHDALVTAGLFTAAEVAGDARWMPWLDALRGDGRATCVTPSAGQSAVWIAAERLPELAAISPALVMAPRIEAPPSRAAVTWTREAALAELFRGRLALLGPTTSAALARPFDLADGEADAALVALEAEGVVLRGSFNAAAPALEWCDRRLLARIHRLTLNRLRAEIEPVAATDFMRFLFAWQHVAPDHRVTGRDGLRAVVEQLDGYELAAGAWETHVLPARVQGYVPALLDELCFGGAIAWGRLSADSGPGKRPLRSTPAALFLRDHGEAWLALTAGGATSSCGKGAFGEAATRIRERLEQRGASFVAELMSALSLGAEETQAAFGELVAAGAITSDGFGGLRAMFVRPQVVARAGAFTTRRGFATAAASGGRWSLLRASGAPAVTRDEAVERQARTLLARYGIVSRRLLAREGPGATWREIVGVLRRLEARGEIRGGRFVHGMSGEQFASPDAIQMLREIRRTAPTGAILTISGADPLNLVGIVTGADRVAAVSSARIAWRDGVPLAVLEGEYVRQLTDYEPAAARAVASALTGRRAPAVVSGFVGAAS